MPEAPAGAEPRPLRAPPPPALRAPARRALALRGLPFRGPALRQHLRRRSPTAVAVREAGRGAETLRCRERRRPAGRAPAAPAGAGATPGPPGAAADPGGR